MQSAPGQSSGECAGARIGDVSSWGRANLARNTHVEVRMRADEAVNRSENLV